MSGFFQTNPTFKITTDALNFESLKIWKLIQKEKLIYYTSFVVIFKKYSYWIISLAGIKKGGK